MKKVFCLVLMCVLCLSLCACNNENSTTLEPETGATQMKTESSDNTETVDGNTNGENPIVLNETDKYCMSIVGYDDETGLFAINIKNKTQYEISSYDSDGSVSVDKAKKCIAETGGTHSFAYAIDIPANEDITVFSSFRVDGNENWETVYKLSDNHMFELMMKVSSGNIDEFWDDTFKVVLTPEMFGY